MQRFKIIVSIIFVLLFVSILPVGAAASRSADSVAADKAINLLIEGNNRFVAEKYNIADNAVKRRAELIKGQHPFAVIVCCSDSRMPPEIIFDQSMGNIFVVRVAGNVLNEVELGSVEYAVAHLGTKLVMVLGHEDCGAVKATVDGNDVSPNIKAITDKIKPAVDKARASAATDIYETAVDNNIINMLALLKADKNIADIDGVLIVGAKYWMKSGKVDFLQ